jgi:cellulose biosynthesis protein BcsQ
MKVITLASQKSGAGKTTRAVHFAIRADKAGQCVVLVDPDSFGGTHGAVSFGFDTRGVGPLHACTASSSVTQVIE